MILAGQQRMAIRALRQMLSQEVRSVRRLTDRTNDEWLQALRSSGAEQSRAIEELRSILVRGLRYGLESTLGRRGAIDQVEDFAQDAVLRILDNLDSFRGESKFTTWAQKIAMRIAFSELRRKRWENVSLDQLLATDREHGTRRPEMRDDAPDPGEVTSAVTAMEVVTSIIENDLTDLQRRALTALIIHGMPMEEVARSMETNRNALYKLLHDARKRVELEVRKRGIDIDDLLSHV